MAEITFPDGFRWGSATAAHQVEGGNWNSDWWVWEHTPGTPCAEPSGDACDHLHRYREDIAFLAGIGLDTYRFSVEWARIEPAEGEFSEVWLRHYRRMAEACREVGVEPMVTFHHFTSPRWVAERGGWAEPETADRFARFCDRTATALAPVARLACTINEPNIVAHMGYQVGIFPPGLQDPDARRRATEVFIDAHRKATEAIGARWDDPRIGMTLSLAEWTPVDGGEQMVEELRGPMEDVFLEAARGDDFIGVQTYTRFRVGPEGILGPEPGSRLTLMGYEYRPEALAATVRRAHSMTGTAVWVTENGIATADDRERIAFVDGALRALATTIDDGVPVLGYTYWSLLDNFEWALGYGPTFGLVAVDRTTFLRTPRPSALWLGEVARANALSDDPVDPSELAS